MNGSDAGRIGLNSGRSWTALPDQEQALEWSLDPAGDFVQGPLKLVFMRGKRILLNQEEGQLALLQEAGELRAVYLEGGHILEVGTQQGQASPESSLIFVSCAQPVHLRWTHGNPIDLPWVGKQHLIGSCSLVVAGPAAFYDKFMRGQSTIEAPLIRDAMESVARQALMDYLTGTRIGEQADPVGLQSTLMNLQAETLSDELAPFGLDCVHLSLYTAAPPVEEGTEPASAEERAGHPGQLTHN
jgi:hypothetical protein